MAVRAHVLNQPKVSFHVITTRCKTHGCEGSVVYGLKASRCDEDADCAEIDDISCERHDVENLIARLEAESNIELDQLLYIVEDYLIELYSR